MSYLATVARQLGLGPILDVKEDLILGSERTYVTHLRLKRFTALQREYGTGRVIYTPHPLLAVEPGERVTRQQLLLVVYGQTPDPWLQRLVTNFKTHFLDVSYVNQSRLTLTQMVSLFRSVSFVIGYQLDQADLFYLLVGAGTPFFLCNSELAEFGHFLQNLNLGHCHHRTEHNASLSYRQIKANLRDIYQHRTEMAEILNHQVDKFRRILSWLPQVRGFRDPDYVPTGAGPLPLAVSAGDYPEPELAALAQQLADQGQAGGIHLELAVLRTFLEDRAVYFHPWLGMLENLDFASYERLVGCREFMASIPTCIGLIVFGLTAFTQLKALLDAAGIDLVIRRFEPPLRREAGFDLEAWLAAPQLVHYGTEGRKVKPLVPTGLPPGPDTASVLVLTRADGLIFGRLAGWLARGQPVVLANSELAKVFLGQDYPLYSEDLRPHLLRTVVTPERVRLAVAYLQARVWPTPEQFVLSLARSKLGRTIGRITRV